VSSQHDEAPARPAESATPSGPEQSTDSAPAAGQSASPVGIAPGMDGPQGPGQGPGAVGYGQATPGGAKPASSTPWKSAADGRTIFRRGTPFVIWWVWVAFAIYNLAQIAIPDHDYFSLELTAGLLAVSAVMYACTVRPRVLADDDGVLVLNPYRDHRIRWGALTGVYLGDSVEFGCARPAPQKEKTIYCWALYSGRRSRIKSQMRADRERSRASGSGAMRRAQAEAQELSRKDLVQLMAAEIGRRSTDARQRGVPDAVLESSWAWWPLVYFLVPAALLVGLVLGR
jgi:Bacterial PH domain